MDVSNNIRNGYGWGPTSYRLLANANLLVVFALQSIMQLGRFSQKFKQITGSESKITQSQFLTLYPCLIFL